MKENINITERDIFAFIFQPDNLSSDKKLYLETNFDQYQKQIEYCKELKEISAGQNDDIQAEAITDRILNPDSIIFLPVKVNISNGDTSLRLAAAGMVLEKKSYSKSFKDESTKRMIKIVSNGKKTLLYYFSEKPIQNTKFTLLPSGATYSMMDTARPIEILDENEIEKVIVEKV